MCLPLHFRNAFLAVSFNYASYCKCFHNSNSRASRRHFRCGRHGRSCCVILLTVICCVRVPCLSVWVVRMRLPFHISCFQTLPGLFYNKSIVCFNKLSVNMCEKNDFLKALMPCRGRKIIIYPAGSFTKYWNHISNFFHLVLLWIYKHMFYFQILSYFFCLRGNFHKCWTERENRIGVIPFMFILSIAEARSLWWKEVDSSGNRPL